MYINRDKAKVGSVNIHLYKGSYRLRFTYPKGKRHSITVAPEGAEGWAMAVRAATLIDRDITIGDLDTTYARYAPRYEAQRVEVVKDNNLMDLWESYKETMGDRVEETTKKNCWSTTDNCLNYVSKTALELNKAELLLTELLKKYKPGTLSRVFIDINAAVNLAVRQGKIDKNPYLTLRLPRRPKKPIECFESYEILNIIQAFKDDRYCSKYSTYLHSYYAEYVEFLAMVGCRPEEAITLTWNDIKHKGNGTFISFSKAYSKGILKRTKTLELRLFPCNEQLIELINRIPKRGELLFPAAKGGYINHKDWRRRYWAIVVKNLVIDSLVEKYLKPYCLRHSFITRLVRDGLDVASIAAIVGTSPEMIFNNYLAAKSDFEVPQL